MGALLLLFLVTQGNPFRVDQNEDGTTPKTDQDERPTLKRRDS